MRGLISRWQSERDPAARDELVALCLPLARRLAGRYRNPHEPFDDLVQVASLGLLGAIDRFDLSRDTPFRAFVIPTILGEIKRHFRQTGWSSHVPRGAQELSMRVQRATEKLSVEGRREPAATELAQYLELELEDVLIGLEARAARYAVSYDTPEMSDDENSEATAPAGQLGDDDDGFDLIEMKLSVATALDRLPHLERQAVRLRMGGDLKQSEIAEQMNCSQMQISRLLRRAADHLHADMSPAAR